MVLTAYMGQNNNGTPRRSVLMHLQSYRGRYFNSQNIRKRDSNNNK